jgi:hypothetical protein
MQVRELMSQPVATCRTTDHLDVPARLMWECDCGSVPSVPIVDEEGRLSGMITDRDITMAAYTTGEPLHAVPVRQVMSKDVLAVQPDAGRAAGAPEPRRSCARRDAGRHLSAPHGCLCLTPNDRGPAAGPLLHSVDAADASLGRRRRGADRRALRPVAAGDDRRRHAVDRAGS